MYLSEKVPAFIKLHRRYASQEAGGLRDLILLPRGKRYSAFEKDRDQRRSEELFHRQLLKEYGMPFYLIASVAALGGLLFGYDTGVISSALLFVRQYLHLSATAQGIVVSAVLAGAMVGAATAGSLSDRYGRRRIILAAALLFVLGAGLSALATSLSGLLAGRVLVGIAIGTASMLTPLYLAEISPAQHRGAIVSLNQFCITLGILVSYLVGYAFAETAEGWRWMLGIGAFPGVVLWVGMIALPESPRWLAGHGRSGDAGAVLERLRGATDISRELQELRADVAREGHLHVAWTGLLAPALRVPLVIGLGLAMFQQITGINTVIYFAPVIFQSAGLPSAATAILATAGVGAVNVIVTVVSIRLIDRMGRRKLLFWSLGGMASMLLVLAATFYIHASEALAWISLIAVAGYVGFFALGLGPVFWLLISEIFPLSLRGRAMSLATVANWAFNFIVSVTFLDLVGAVGSAGAFLIYALLTAAALMFTATVVPETKGYSLEEIEAQLMQRVRRKPLSAIKRAVE
jgi:sugar porter (SP) family MFS transporter